MLLLGLSNTEKKLIDTFETKGQDINNLSRNTLKKDGDCNFFFSETEEGELLGTEKGLLLN